MSAKYIIPALAIAGRAYAQCSAATTTIQNAGDASALASCRTFSGSIAIATGTTDAIALDGIQEIDGSLIADNATLITTLSADSLETITDSFSLSSLTVLSTLNFPRLTTVDTIDWTALPALQGLSFTTGVQEVNRLSITNTYLGSLDGINLQVVDEVVIANNNYLEDITMQLGNITTALTLESNGRMVQAVFPNLEWAFNMTFRNCSSVYIPSLASLNGSLGFYSNEFNNITAPNLTTVGGSLTFVSNEQLTNITFPQLKTVSGGLQVANNTELGSIGFPNLATVGGALDFNGNFTEVTLPQLNDVRGAFNLQSSENIDDACSHFSGLSGENNVIKGAYTCAGQQEKPGGTGTLAPGTNSGSGSGSSSSATASSSADMIKIGGATGLMGVVAAVFGML